MAALSTFTGLSAAEEIVPTEEINGFIAGYEYPIPVSMAIAWVAPGTGSTPHRFPRWGQITVPAGAKTETDTFSDANIETTEGTGTPGMVGFRMAISDELVAAATSGVPASVLVEGIRALTNRMDSDLCGVSTSATNATGAISDAFTLAKFRSALAAYKALRVPDSPFGHALVLDHGPAAALLESLHSSAATMLLSQGDSLGLGPVAGRLGRLYGVEVFETGNVADESTGKSNFMTPIGATHSGLGLVLSKMPHIEVSRGDDAAVRKTTYYVFAAWYAAALANSRRFLEVLSDD